MDRLLIGLATGSLRRALLWCQSTSTWTPTTSFRKRAGFWLGALAGLAVLCASLLPPTGLVVGAEPDERHVVLERTAEIRGLSILADVPFEFVPSAQVRAAQQAAFESDQQRSRLSVAQKLMIELGLLDENQDLSEILGRRVGGVIAGFYSESQKKMFIVSDSGQLGLREQLILSHEFTHALQDQHFDLRTLKRAAAGNDDRVAALAALVEGDARTTETEYARANFSPEIFGRVQAARDCVTRLSLENSPLVIRDEFLFPYCEGAVFVGYLIRLGGFEAVNQAFSNPPTSTEQIIHPDKFLQREEPVEVTLPDLATGLGQDWSLLRSGVLGELDLRILLQQHSGPEIAAVGSAGWGGDHYALLERADGARALVVRTVWDDDAEAQQFFGALVSASQRRFGVEVEARRLEDGSLAWSLTQPAIRIVQSGSRVDFLKAADSAVIEQLAGLLDLT